MKRQIRCGVFETNSSSVNTLIIMTADEYKDFMEKWESDNWVWNCYGDAWVRKEDAEDEEDEYMYWENPCEDPDGWVRYETEEERYTTEHGDKIVALSIYGYNG